MKNVVAYIRVSTGGQVGEDKFGLEVQKQQISEYCKKNDMNILKWYADEGESGAKERPGFDEIVYGDVSNPPIEAVVAAKTDRVARDIEIYYYYKMLLRKKSIELISVAEDFGSFGVFSGMLESFTICVAKMERDNINKRTSCGRAAKSASGGYSGGRTPFGYRPQDGKMVIVPEEADIVKTIFKMKDDDGQTYQSIVDKLNGDGLKNRKGNPFVISTVQTIYENKNVYLGMYRYGKRSNKDAPWVQGQHEPILKN